MPVVPLLRRDAGVHGLTYGLPFFFVDGTEGRAYYFEPSNLPHLFGVLSFM